MNYLYDSYKYNIVKVFEEYSGDWEEIRNNFWINLEEKLEKKYKPTYEYHAADLVSIKRDGYEELRVNFQMIVDEDQPTSPNFFAMTINIESDVGYYDYTISLSSIGKIESDIIKQLNIKAEDKTKNNIYIYKRNLNDIIKIIDKVFNLFEKRDFEFFDYYDDDVER